MGTQNAETGGVKTAHKVFGVVETLEELDEAGVSEVAEHMGLAVSTVHDHLKTLEELGYVVREDKEYRLGLKFLGLGMSARRNVELARKARPFLERLAEETDETAWLVVEEHGLGVHIEKAQGEHGVRTANRIGRRSHLHYHASGKAILAHLPRERVEAIIEERGLPELTEYTITDREELHEELERVRERGYAHNDNEEIVGTRSVGAPIIVDGEVLGAIGVGGPANRLRGDRFERELPEQVSGVANEIKLEIQYS